MRKLTQKLINVIVAFFYVPLEVLIILGMKHDWKRFIVWVAGLGSPYILLILRTQGKYPDWAARLLYPIGGMDHHKVTDGVVDRDLFQFLVSGSGPVAVEVAEFNQQQQYFYGDKAKLVKQPSVVTFNIDNPSMRDAELLRMAFGVQVNSNGEPLTVSETEDFPYIILSGEEVELPSDVQQVFAQQVDLNSKYLHQVTKLFTDPVAISKFLERGTQYLQTGRKEALENNWVLRTMVNRPHLTDEHLCYVLENNWVSVSSYAYNSSNWVVNLTPRLMDCLITLDYHSAVQFVLTKDNVSLNELLMTYSSTKITEYNKELLRNKMMQLTVKTSWLEFVKYALQLSHYRLSEIEQLPVSWLEDLLVSEHGYVTSGKGAE